MSGEAISTSISALIMNFISALCDVNLTWQKENEDRIKVLQMQRTLSVEKLHQEIQKRKLEFEREMMLQEHQLQEELEKKKLEADARNYQRFLDSIDELRDKLEELYPGMPPALILVIHQYASQLLNKMWDSSDARERLLYQKDFVQFLALVSEDANQRKLQGEANQPTALPQRTLRHIQENTSSQYGSVIADARVLPEIEISLLLSDLFATDAKVRSEAALRLGQIGSEKVVPALVQVLTIDQNPEVRRSAAEALGMIGSGDAETKG